MPAEVEELRGKPYIFETCPKCGQPFSEFLRGQVQRSPRFLGFLWQRSYCAVICHKCKEIIGWEHQQKGERG